VQKLNILINQIRAEFREVPEILQKNEVSSSLTIGAADENASEFV